MHLGVSYIIDKCLMEAGVGRVIGTSEIMGGGGN